MASAQIGIMIEGQDGLNWARWKRLLQAVQDLGFQCLFRSDHFTNASGPDKDSLELWVSLTYAASHTTRIEFGPLVTPVTFRHPALNARMAAQVDDLSDGRLVFGLGAGWQEREHRKFGIPFYDFPTRYEMLSDALEITARLYLTDGPVTYEGQHFSLEDAQLLPRPSRPGGPPILIGGNGPKKTLPLVARYADEWNALFVPVSTYKERTEILNHHIRENGRELSDVKRSLMTGTIFARDEADLKQQLEARSARAGQPVTLEGLRERGMIVGTASMWVDQIGEMAEAGVERFMLQWLNQDDINGLELVARDVLPQFHGQ
ncbi:MAG: TIGR03560 family F420-dependent LLM class oxidoreductase [Chloroflexota bacterium]